MMGLSWIFVITVYVLNIFFTSFNDLQFMIDLHRAFGIYVFILLIVKRSTLKLIMERYYEYLCDRKIHLNNLISVLSAFARVKLSGVFVLKWKETCLKLIKFCVSCVNAKMWMIPQDYFV